MMIHQTTTTLRWRLTRLAMALRDRREHRSDPGAYPLRREYGGWTVRPFSGWRSVRGVTPPLAYTRHIPATDRDAAIDWAMEKMHLG
ncbi:hypothetical protein [Nocardia salmonicida]|uniref:hypothetical protein n=1 Tax=Nocardia salmonicida TaxID=53431 RepID=UPI002E28A580|nr:hypothetical protein [Nocardia salmonicida]